MTQNLSSIQGGSVVGCIWMIGPAGKRDAASCNEIVPLEVEHLPFLQHVVNSTYKNIWTRDRRKHHPETWHNYSPTSNIQLPLTTVIVTVPGRFGLWICVSEHLCSDGFHINPSS